jgi:hypothetical protein
MHCPLRSLFLWIPVLFFLFLADGPKVYSQTLPSAQQLLILAPHLSLQEKDINSFQATGKFDFEQISLKFELFAERPDKTALRVLDPQDSTPILWACSGEFMFYDPLADEIVIGKGNPLFVFRMEKVSQEVKQDGLGEEQLSFGFGVSTEAATSVSGMALDLRSFWMNRKSLPEVHPGEKGTFLLRGRTQKGGRIIAHVNPARSGGPYERFELFMSDAGKDPFCSLDKIAINQPLKSSRFDFPKKFMLDSGMRIRQMGLSEEAGFQIDMGRLVRAILARLAIYGGNEKVKDLVEKMYSRKPDWGALAERDRQASRILKLMIKEER